MESIDRSFDCLFGRRKELTQDIFTIIQGDCEKRYVSVTSNTKY